MAVVCRPGDSGMETALTRLGFGHHEWVVNPNPDEGMFSSIQAAALWKGWGDGLSHYVVTLGDQPHLSLKTLEALFAFAEKSTDTICQPSFKARPRHPVILPRRLFHEVGAAQEVTFRGFLERSDMKRRLCEIDDPGLNIDLDTPEEYEAVREKWLQGADQ